MNGISDVEIVGTVYKLTLQTDSRGAVLVAYTRGDNGQIGRSWIRLDRSATDYMKQRLSAPPIVPSGT